MGDDEVALEGGWQTAVHRAGDVVLRAPGVQSSTVLALLCHLRDAGFDGAPHPIGDGVAPDGREQLTYVDGTSPHPGPWPDDVLPRLGALLHAVHDATATFTPPSDARWRPWFARRLPGDRPVIGHGDLGPWNIVRTPDDRLVLLDWDNAGPVDALWDLALLVWLNAHLHDDDVAGAAGLADAATRAHHARLIVDGYGLPIAERATFVDRLVELAIRSARDEAIDRGITPGTPSPAPDGYPLLWAVTWRTRAAAWMLDHRRLLQDALT